MFIAAPKETHPGETRVALTPEGVAALVQLGAEVGIEPGLGEGIHQPNEAYTKAGAVVLNKAELSAKADMVCRVRHSSPEEVKDFKEGCIHISHLDPFTETSLIDIMAKQGLIAVSLEMLPRTTRAQKMDVLSSQANLAGYAAVITAAERLDKAFPMMMTPAGTISPARVFVIGAGVAGLQAIATAKRLGARVEAFDTRPVVEEQVRSLGAKFVKIDIGETGQTANGYAKALTPEQIAMQQAGMAKVCAQSDVVITTAKLFGRPSPILLTKAMISGMQRGSVVVDLAVESGGNVEGIKPDAEEVRDGVRIVGLANMPARVAVHASQVYSSNIISLISEFWDAEAKHFVLDADDEILKAILLTRDGAVIHPALTKEQ